MKREKFIEKLEKYFKENHLRVLIEAKRHRFSTFLLQEDLQKIRQIRDMLALIEGLKEIGFNIKFEAKYHMEKGLKIHAYDLSAGYVLVWPFLPTGDIEAFEEVKEENKIMFLDIMVTKLEKEIEARIEWLQSDSPELDNLAKLLEK